MKKASKRKSPSPPVDQPAMPSGVAVHTGSTKGLKKWFARAELEVTGGCRSRQRRVAADRSRC